MRKRKYQSVLFTFLLTSVIVVGSGFSVNAETNINDSAESTEDNHIINLPYSEEQEIITTTKNYVTDDELAINLSDNSVEDLSGNIQLIDQADLLTASEAEEVEEMIEEFEDKTGWDVMAVTTEDAEGMSATSYAESWLNEYMSGEDGIIWCIDMDNREIVVSGTGDAIDCLTDAHKENILDAGYEKVSNEEYAETFETMIRKTGKYAYKQITVIEILIALGIALVAGGITVGVIVGSYRLKFGGYKYPIEKNGSVKLRKKEDAFVNQFVTHRHIPKSDGSGGGKTTTHSGAGGRTYSSGSRKF